MNTLDFLKDGDILRKFANSYYLKYTCAKYLRDVDDNFYIFVSISCFDNRTDFTDFIKGMPFMFVPHNPNELQYEYSGWVKKRNLKTLKKQCNKNGLSLKYDRIVCVDNELPDGMLFAYRNNRYYRTKLTVIDLPESYCHLQNLGWDRYIRTDGVTQLVYKPSLITDESTKDDILFIFYDGNTPDRNDNNSTLYDSCDDFVFGRDIELFMDYVEKYSDIDVSNIKKKMSEREDSVAKVFNERFGSLVKEVLNNG